MAPVSTASCRSRNGVTVSSTRCGLSSSESTLAYRALALLFHAACGLLLGGLASISRVSLRPVHCCTVAVSERSASALTLTGGLVSAMASATAAFNPLLPMVYLLLDGAGYGVIVSGNAVLSLARVSERRVEQHSQAVALLHRAHVLSAE